MGVKMGVKIGVKIQSKEQGVYRSLLCFFMLVLKINQAY